MRYINWWNYNFNSQLSPSYFMLTAFVNETYYTNHMLIFSYLSILVHQNIFMTENFEEFYLGRELLQLRWQSVLQLALTPELAGDRCTPGVNGSQTEAGYTWTFSLFFSDHPFLLQTRRKGKKSLPCRNCSRQQWQQIQMEVMMVVVVMMITKITVVEVNMYVILLARMWNQGCHLPIAYSYRLVPWIPRSTLKTQVFQDNNTVAWFLWTHFTQWQSPTCYIHLQIKIKFRY